MNSVSILISRELSAIFGTWGVYFGLIIFYLICGLHCWFGPENFLFIGQATMNPFFDVATWLILFLAPVLTMRTISDENKRGTLELLLTMPIVTNHLVAAKYWSQLAIATLAILLTVPFYLTIGLLGNLDHGATLLGYWGLWSMAGCFISMGIFASSVTRTPITAFCIAMGLELCFFILFPFLSDIIVSGFWSDLFAYLSVTEHFNSMTNGILDSRDIIYFSSVVTLFLTLSKYFICRSRY
ncbi:MAG: ABC transporter permease subunit [Marinifilaceae bacterium]